MVALHVEISASLGFDLPDEKKKKSHGFGFLSGALGALRRPLAVDDPRGMSALSSPLLRHTNVGSVSDHLTTFCWQAAISCVPDFPFF